MTASDWTLRDARRYISRHGYLPGRLLSSRYFVDSPEARWHAMGQKRQEACLDAMISKYGADALFSEHYAEIDEAGEFRPKDTDEVIEDALGLNEDASVHGGDGASGEVASPAGFENGEETGEEVEVDADAEGDGPSSDEDKGDGATSDGADGGVYRDSFGGCFANYADIAPASTEDAKALIRAISRLVEKKIQVGRGQTPVPRYDARKLVREGVSRRWQLSRSRQEVQEQQEVVILACDVSGSCANVCQDTLAAVKGVATRFPGLVLPVVHSNGVVIPISGQWTRSLTVDKWLEETHPDAHCRLLVNMGDTDGWYVWVQMAKKGTDVVLLDCWRCSLGNVFLAADRQDQFEDVPFLAWWGGVSNAADAAAALRKTVRKL